ncbi:MAG: 50S ribosomal protein L11 methyltransferase, partial [Anaerolineae bacterium]|nr:50S ribosomal protein L11 methyltransferase [Anaerolineae bacterium]
MPSSPEPHGPEWIEVTVACPASDVEAQQAVAALFQRWGQGGAVLEEAPGEEHIRLKTYLPADSPGAAVRKEVEIGLALLRHLYPHLGEPVFRHLAQDDWAQAWKRAYQLQRIGRSLVIVPSWEPYAPRAGEHVVRLDPGLAFGTGLHETTRLCLALLEVHLRPGARLADVGTGSGILAIAAARLGAAQVVALDADPIAVRAARENVARNQVKGVVQVRWGTVPGGEENPWGAPVLGYEEVGGPFHLVLVNILAEAVIQMLRTGLVGWLAPGGLLIASGMLTRQGPAVT